MIGKESHSKNTSCQMTRKTCSDYQDRKYMSSLDLLICLFISIYIKLGEI
jgi:hypothetical protein